MKINYSSSFCLKLWLIQRYKLLNVYLSKFKKHKILEDEHNGFQDYIMSNGNEV